MAHRQVQELHELVVAGQVDPTELGDMALRDVVADSWRRSISRGVDPDRQGPQSADDNELERLRRAHPLTAAMPLIRRLLVDDAAEAGHMVGVADASGTLLWVEGNRRACRKGEAMNFLPGADWSERSAGTNAPGTALVVDREVQIRRWEHFSRVAQPWSCWA
jgi:transcriptional regulator of acetoin/glycerol metabolism